MRSKVILALLLLLAGAASQAQNLASPYSNSVFKAQTFTGAGTGAVIQLNGLIVPSTVGSSFASGTITLTGTSLTTVTFAVQGSSDNGVTYYPLPIYLGASPTTIPTTSVTATANGLYQINLAGLTHVKFVTSGTFTATSVSLVLTASPNAMVSKGGGGGGSVTAPAMQAAMAGQAGCTTAGNAWNPATNMCVPASGGGAAATVEHVFTGALTINYTHNLGTTNPLMTCYVLSGAPIGSAVPADANNIAITTTGAGDILCAFAFAPSGTAPTPDFSFTVATTPITLVPILGTSHPTFTVTQGASGGFTGVTTYSESSAPSGITGVYSPTTITTSGTSTLTTNILYNQTSGANVLTLTGVSGAKTHSQPATINIATTNDGLLEGWPANEGSGSTLNTVSASGANLAGTAITWTTPTGFPVPVATFNGTTSIATAANHTNTDFNGATPFSVCAWVKFSAYGTEYEIAGNLNTGASFIGWEIAKSIGDGLQFFLINNFGGNNAVVVSSSGTPFAGSGAQFACVTYDGSKTAAGVKLYINGAIETAMINTNGLTLSTASGLSVNVGARMDGTTPLSGSIGYVRIYNRVVTSGEVTTLFTAGPK